MPPDGAVTREIDLAALEVAVGTAVEVTVRVPVEPLRLSGQDYVVDPPEPEMRVGVTRAISGWHLRLRGRCTVTGPCWRCLVASEHRCSIHAEEFQAKGRAGQPFDEDLDSAYVEGPKLDVASWLRDAVVEALPVVMLCRDACKGLCASCGADLNQAPCACEQPPPDASRPFSGLTERLLGGSEGA